jgi:hypothetical protein
MRENERQGRVDAVLEGASSGHARCDTRETATSKASEARPTE